MKVTRRGLFATITAAFAAKRTALPLTIRKMIRCECPGCQYARGFLSCGGYEFYPDAFTISGPKIGDTISVRKPTRQPANALVTPEKAAGDYLTLLKRTTLEL